MKEIWQHKGPILLLAGPGAGKTFSLAQRIKYLIEGRGVDPEYITVITFTKEAARNMRESISNQDDAKTFVEYERQPKRIITMHGLGNDIVLKNYKLVGMSEEPKLLPRGLDEILLMDSAQLLGFRRKDALETADCRHKGKCCKKSDMKCKICLQYKKLLAELNYVDYDDQIMLAVEILKTDATVAKEVQKACRHLLVDEYQDINDMQHNLIKQLTKGQEEGLFAVGDDDQSIYSWRGGSPEYILNFDKEFKGVAVKEITECRRCDEVILNSALRVIEQNNPHRKVKHIKSITGHKGDVFIFDVPSDIKESKIIVGQLKKAINAKRGVLILVPRHSFSDILKRELKNNHISYTCRMDVEKKALAVLDGVFIWLNNINDRLFLRFCIERIVTKQFRGAKIDRILLKISRLWKLVFKENTSLFKVMKESKDKDIETICTFLDKIISSYKEEPSTFISAVTQILKLWNDNDTLEKEISYWVEEGRGQSASSGSVVRIMSMQGAKGLSADVVFVIGITEDIIPQGKLTEEEKREARRLLYVSMTRAKRQLYLYHARKRSPKVSYKSDFKSGLKISSFARPTDIKPIYIKA